MKNFAEILIILFLALFEKLIRLIDKDYFIEIKNID